MSNNILFICSHGDFAKEIIKSAEMIVGPMEQVIPFCLKPGMSGDDFLEVIKAEAQMHKGDHILAIVDLFGGTPCTTCARLLKEYDLHIITGLNLGMLIEVYSMLNSCDMKELKQTAISTLQMSCVDVNKKMGLD